MDSHNLNFLDKSSWVQQLSNSRFGDPLRTENKTNTQIKTCRRADRPMEEHVKLKLDKINKAKLGESGKSGGESGDKSKQIRGTLPDPPDKSGLMRIGVLICF
jgi:hypothetical protein